MTSYRSSTASPFSYSPEPPSLFFSLPQLLRVYDDGHVEFIRFVWAKLDMHEKVEIGYPTDSLMLETHIASLSHRLANVAHAPLV